MIPIGKGGGQASLLVLQETFDAGGAPLLAVGEDAAWNGTGSAGSEDLRANISASEWPCSFMGFVELQACRSFSLLGFWCSPFLGNSWVCSAGAW